MKVLLFAGFLMMDLAVAFYDVDWFGSAEVSETEEDGLVQTMDGGWPPPPDP